MDFVREIKISSVVKFKFSDIVRMNIIMIITISNNYFTPFLQRHYLRTHKIHAMVWHAPVIEYLFMDLTLDYVKSK